MNQKTKMRYISQKGITLIAIVITIIVLLILAGVTISMALGDDGIIAQAQQAKKANEDSSLKDAISVAKGEAALTPYVEQTPLDYTKAKETFPTLTLNTYKNSVAKIVDGVPIPVGFAYVEGTKVDTGLIIVDGYENEFVWVPVKNMNDFILDSDFGGWTGSEPATVVEYPWGGEGADAAELNRKAILDDGYENSIEGLGKQFKDEYDAMVASVKAYGGFYVGRYETGWDATNKVVVSKAGVPMTETQDLASVGWKCIGTNGPEMESEITKATWYGLYAKQKELYKKNSSSSVVSGMIYGCQWDAIMNWMQNSTDANVRTFVTNSDGMGWYVGVSGNSSQETGKDLDGGKNKVNNIYDLAGNYYEGTQEAYDSFYRVNRGGNLSVYGSSNPASTRLNRVPTNAYENITSRLQLYIK